MICRNCNQQYNDTAYNCPYCGNINNIDQGCYYQPQEQSGSTYAQPCYSPQYQDNAVTKTGLGFAAVSLVCGILSILFCFLLPPLSFILGILGIVFGVVSKTKTTKYRGLATGGIVCGIIGLLIVIFFMIIAVVIATEALRALLYAFVPL